MFALIFADVPQSGYMSDSKSPFVGMGNKPEKSAKKAENSQNKSKAPEASIMSPRTNSKSAISAAIKVLDKISANFCVQILRKK